jgi:hypothetical protein
MSQRALAPVMVEVGLGTSAEHLAMSALQFVALFAP